MVRGDVSVAILYCSRYYCLPNKGMERQGRAKRAILKEGMFTGALIISRALCAYVRGAFLHSAFWLCPCG